MVSTAPARHRYIGLASVQWSLKLKHVSFKLSRTCVAVNDFGGGMTKW